MGQIQSLDEFLGLLQRRRWLILLIVVIGILVSVMVASSRTNSYETAAVIQIETPTVTEGQGSAAPSGAAQMLQAIEQRLTTRENLLEMIARHGLFADAPGLSDDRKVALLRSSVRFETVASATGQSFGSAPQISALLIFARLGDPELAARVDNDLAQSILDQSSAGLMDAARETTEFFAGEETRVWTQIAALEAEISAFKNANAAALPEQGTALRSERVALEDDLRRIDQDQLALRGRIAAIGTGGTLRATDQRALADLQSQSDVLAAQGNALVTRRAEIDAVLAQTPEVDRVLSGFDRRLQQLQDEYEVITRRMAEAATTQRLAERQQAERFTLLERAVTPQYANGTGGKKIVIAGAVASLIAAVAIAFLLDLANPVVRSADQMERQLGLRPVVSIPEVGAAARSTLRARALLSLVDDPRRPILGLPRYAVFAGGATLCLVLAAAAIG